MYSHHRITPKKRARRSFTFAHDQDMRAISTQGKMRIALIAAADAVG